MADAHTGNYQSVGEIWAGVSRPPLSMVEALRAARRLTRHFGATKFGAPHQLVPAKMPTKARRCWASRRGDITLHRGWERLVHDVSHAVFRHRHPQWTPHHPSHARLEREMAAYVLAQGWLGGRLKPAEPASRTLSEKREARRANLTARLARWQTREKRARTAMRKIRAALKRLDKAQAVQS